MEFRLHLPSSELRPMVQGYLEADSRNMSAIGIHTLFPNGFSGIFFNFGRLGKLMIKEDHHTPAISVFGQIDQCFEAVHFPGSFSLGILFHPTALSRFLRINMAELTNKALDGTLLRSDLIDLYHQLEDTISVRQKVEQINRYLLEKLLKNKSEVSVVDQAIASIHRGTGFAVHQLARDLKVSTRHLEVQFKRAVGLTPKTYSMIIRFKQMEQALTQKKTTQWNHLDFAHHYYDQNHFIKDFKRFTGHTPSEYLLNSFDMGRSYLLR